MEVVQEELPNRTVTAAVLGLASTTIMANATVASSLPGLREFYADVPHIETLAGLIVTLPSLAILLSAGLMGLLIDRWDRQKILLVTAACYAIGGTSGLWAQSLWGILAGRLVLGVGVAGTMNLGMTWAGDLWQGPARARFLGMQGAAISAAGIVFMLLGGFLASIHWRGAFAVYALVVPIAAFAYVALGPYARRIEADRHRPKPALSAEDRFPWAAYAFIAPMAFMFQAAFYLTPTRLPFLLQSLGTDSPMVMGALMAALVMVSAPVSLMYGRIRQRISAMTVFGLAFVLFGVAFMAHATASSWHGVLLGSLIGGVAMGISMPNYTTWFMARVPASMRGRAAGLLTMAFFLGQFSSPLVSAPLVASLGLAGTFAAVGLGLITLGVGLWVANAVWSEPIATEA